jgi:hypothetical protein
MEHRMKISKSNTAAVTTRDTLASGIADPITGKTSTGSVVLRGLTVALDSQVGEAFISDCARYTEGLLPDSEIKGKWVLSHQDWVLLAGNKPLLDAVRAERDRRIHNGDAAREAAQRHFAKAPTVLGSILSDEQISPRNRIEAAKELRQVAGNGADAFLPKEKIVISIDLGEDYKLYREIEVAPQKPAWPDDGELP